MTYLVEWDGVKIADDHRTLSLLHGERPSAIESISGCGQCRDCLDVDFSEQGVQFAPWYHASNPASADFYGAIVTHLQGAMDRPTSAKVVEGIRNGGWVSGLREGPRDVRMKMTLLASSEAGLNAGQAWLGGILESVGSNPCTEGSVVRFGVACPTGAGTAAHPDPDVFGVFEEDGSWVVDDGTASSPNRLDTDSTGPIVNGPSDGATGLGVKREGGSWVIAPMTAPTLEGSWNGVYTDSEALRQITDRQLVRCFMIDGPRVKQDAETCGLYMRDLEMGLLSERGKLMRPTQSHLAYVQGTSGPGVVVETPSSVPAICPPAGEPDVMRDPLSPIPPSPIPPAAPGNSWNRTTFSHKRRVTVPLVGEPWVDRALRVVLHANDGDIDGARVRVFPMTDYTSCGEVAEFYIRYLKDGYSFVVDGIHDDLFAWTGNPDNWAQASHLIRSIYSNSYFDQPLVPGGAGFYVVVESQGKVSVSLESAVIE